MEFSIIDFFFEPFPNVDINSKYQYEYFNTHLDLPYCLYKLEIYLALNLLDLSSLFGKVAKMHVYLHLPSQYWLFSKSAW